MATATITEYAEMSTDKNGNVVGPREPNLTSEQVTYTTATNSGAIDSRAKFIRIATDGTKAHYAIGTSPTATAESAHVPPNSDLIVGVDTSIGTLLVSLYDGTS